MSARRRSVVRAVLGVIAASSPALAQPVTQPEHAPCVVEIVHAPPAVRAAIETWVRAEPRCDKHLEVRVVPTAGGFYLIARDEQGRVRERVVPDAQSVAVLVTSWAADDSLPSAPAPAPEGALESPTPVEVAPAAPAAPAATHPRAVRQLDESSELDLGTGFRTRTGERHWLVLGGSLSPHADLGLRAQVDVLDRGAWRFGIAGAWFQRDRDTHDMDLPAHASSTQLGAYAARTIDLGRVQLRAQLGLGAAVTRVELMDGSHETAIKPYGEASVLATLPFGDRFGLVAGPVLRLMQPDRDDGPALDASLFFGLQVGL